MWRRGEGQKVWVLQVAPSASPKSASRSLFFLYLLFSFLFSIFLPPTKGLERRERVGLRGRVHEDKASSRLVSFFSLSSLGLFPAQVFLSLLFSFFNQGFREEEKVWWCG